MGANERIRLGIIGCGGGGRDDWGTFLNQPDVELMAACDVYEPFLIRRLPLARALMTVAACDAGKDVSCEKPLSLMLGEGRHMVSAARRDNRVVHA
jgi:predicted dehydrogenase